MFTSNLTNALNSPLGNNYVSIVDPVSRGDDLSDIMSIKEDYKKPKLAKRQDEEPY